VGVEEVFLVVGQAPFGHDGAAAADDAGEAVGGEGHVFEAHPGVDGEVVHALFGLFNEGVAEHFPGEVFGLAVDLFQCLIDGHGADGHGGVAQDPLAGFVDVLAGGEIHQGVATPAGGPDHFFHFFLDRGRYRRVTDICIDFHAEVAPDDHRFQLRVVDVGRDNGPSGGHFTAHKLGGDEVGDVGAEGFPFVLAQQFAVAGVFAHFLQFQVFADGDEFHFRGDDPLAGVVHLADVLAGDGLARGVDVFEAQVGQFGIVLAGGAVFTAGAAELFGVVALGDPVFTQGGQALEQVDVDGRVGVGTGGVIYIDRRVQLFALFGVGDVLADFAHGDADVGAAACDVDFFRCGEGTGDFVRKLGRLVQKFLRDCAHGQLPHC